MKFSLKIKLATTQQYLEQLLLRYWDFQPSPFKIHNRKYQILAQVRSTKVITLWPQIYRTSIIMVIYCTVWVPRLQYHKLYLRVIEINRQWMLNISNIRIMVTGNDTVWFIVPDPDRWAENGLVTPTDVSAPFDQFPGTHFSHFSPIGFG